MSNSIASSAVKAAVSDGVLQIGTLAIDATPEKFKTTTTLYWRRLGIQFSKAATTALVFSAAYTINTDTASGIKYGAFLVMVNDAGTVSTKAVSADQAYASAAAAIAALPAVDAGKTVIGYIVVGAKTGASWTATTDDMTAASDCASVSFVDATPVVSLASLA